MKQSENLIELEKQQKGEGYGNIVLSMLFYWHWIINIISHSLYSI